ncbi:conserved hypothetical protein [Parafrankia sp. EAN1pec]|nr:conserved hypothetical protein [Frankia sp. EAN1pec]
MVVPAGVPRIDFRAHQVRTGTEGARHEFEQMIALLVQRTVGEARQIVASGGDWGIDVMVGDLGAKVTIWQAKYFIDGFGSGQLSQVKSSFGRACAGARQGGYKIERWVLCVPCDLTHKMLGSWQRWRDEQVARTGITIDLWDATALTSLLLDRRMDDLRRGFYDPYGPALPEDEGGSGDRPPARLRTTADQTASPDLQVWQGGSELLVGARGYLLHDPVETWTAPDRSWLLRDATADELDGTSRRVRLRQLQVRRDTAASAAVRAGLTEQAGLVQRLAGTPGLPGRLGWDISSSRATLVTSLVSAPTWRAVHGGGAPTLDRLAAAAMLGHADDLCRNLMVLHRRGLGHGQVTSDSVLLVDGRRRTVLRDLGLAGFGPAGSSAVTAAAVPTGDELSGGDPRADDVRQVAALVRRSLALRPPELGRPPGPVVPPPAVVLRPPPAPVGTGPGWPDLADLAALLDRALHPGPAGRPAILELADGLRAARRRLSAGR